MTKDSLDAYGALSVSGSRIQTVVGIAATAHTQNDFWVGVERHGTRLIQRGCVQVVDTNGSGLRACIVLSGHYTQTGTQMSSMAVYCEI
jgi:hypothetical protein